MLICLGFADGSSKWNTYQANKDHIVLKVENIWFVDEAFFTTDFRMKKMEMI